MARAYLPEHVRDDLSRRARLYHGLYAIEIAEQKIGRRAWSAAGAQLREAFRCSVSLPIAGAAAQLAWRAVMTVIRRPAQA